MGLIVFLVFVAASVAIGYQLGRGKRGPKYAMISSGSLSNRLAPTVIKFTELCRAHKVPTTIGIVGGALPAPGTHVFLVGDWSPYTLESLCKRLQANGCYANVVVDAINKNDREIRVLLAEMNEHWLAQMVVSAAAERLIKGVPLLYVYPFPKADDTTTVAILFDGGKNVLAMERGGDPFKGFLSLPGGFLNVLLETLPQCAVRELHEEVFTAATSPVLSADELELIDVRSDPERDFRGHVVDHGYAWLVPDERKQSVLDAIQAGDDAKPGSARVVAVEEALSKGLAFDHEQLLRAALKHLSVA